MVSSASRRMMLTVLSHILARSGRETVEQTTNGILKMYVGAIGRMDSQSMERAPSWQVRQSLISANQRVKRLRAARYRMHVDLSLDYEQRLRR